MLLFTPLTYVCTIVHNNITSTSQQLKQIHKITFIILEITQQNYRKKRNNGKKFI